MYEFPATGYRYSLENTPVTLGYRKSSRVSQTRHFHDFFEILYVIDGMRHVFAGGETHALRKGDLLFIPPEMLHKSLGLSGESEIYSLYLPDSGEYSMLARESIRIGAESESAGKIGSLLDDIAAEFRGKAPGYELMISARCSEIAGSIARSRTVRPDARETRMMEIAAYIGKHSSEDLKLGRLAEIFSFSESYLSRAFHRETGFTVVEYINHIRVLEARALLKGSGEKISRIGEMCGFGSITHFGRVFRALTGSSPRDWRRGN